MIVVAGNNDAAGNAAIPVIVDYHAMREHEHQHELQNQQPVQDDVRNAPCVNDPDDSSRRYIKFSEYSSLSAADATFLIAKLAALNNDNNNNNNNNDNTKTVLSLSRMNLSRPAQSILCNGISHLRRNHLRHDVTENMLHDISHGNTSCIDLQVDFPAETDAQRLQASESIARFMHNRAGTSLRGLVVGNAYCPLPAVPPFLQALRQTLCRLGFQTRRLGDYSVEVLVNAIVHQHYDTTNNTNNTQCAVLSQLDLSTNRITARGLVMLSRLDATILQHLHRLVLNYNAHLLDDAASMRIFCQRMLLLHVPPSTTSTNGGAATTTHMPPPPRRRTPPPPRRRPRPLQVLQARCCSDEHHGYSVLVQSPENHTNSLT